MNKKEYLLKRPFDILLSGGGLVVSSPLWLVIAIIILLEGRGPVFYSSKRVGKEGRLFDNLKFRTMVSDSDEKYGPLQARENDKRITKIGKILRVTAMDELPQLWNIFRGDMSFVGPRALLPVEIETGEGGSGEPIPISDIPGYDKRISVTPGLTGIAQIFAPRDIVRKHKFAYDLLYIKRQSFKLDIKLILLSFWITFRGKWETRGKKF
ncbi:MAG: hypothetical protein DHS20C13_06570 [Thermodesulfobacteriota bacterium]|nr:MAG: hypothetical protein DHS20C13_06570 [Thermodesulfobacteriota bacterium]